MNIKTLIVSVLATLSLLSGCAQKELTAPCPDFGRSCTQSPINSWDYNR